MPLLSILVNKCNKKIGYIKLLRGHNVWSTIERGGYKCTTYYVVHNRRCLLLVAVENPNRPVDNRDNEVMH